MKLKKPPIPARSRKIAADIFRKHLGDGYREDRLSGTLVDPLVSNRLLPLDRVSFEGYSSEGNYLCGKGVLYSFEFESVTGELVGRVDAQGESYLLGLRNLRRLIKRSK